MKHIKFLFILLTITMLVSGCDLAARHNQKIKFVSKDKGNVEVFFCPRDNCSNILEEHILNASSNIHCAFFDLDLKNIINILDRQDKNHIDTKLIVDSDNFKYVKQLNFVRQDNRSAFMHNKFCILDNTIITGSLNPTINGVKENNNNLIIIESDILAQNYKQEFDEIWNNIYGQGNKTNNPIIYINQTKIKNYFCPEDDCGEKIEQELKKAKRSIKFMTFSFTHTGIANEILMKHYKGIDIKGIFDSLSANTKYSKYKLFKFQEIESRKDNSSAIMHHKVFIIDNTTTITGSFNPSKNADTRNDENILIINNPKITKQYIKEFNYIWKNQTENEKEI